MNKLAIVLSIAALLALGACEQRQQTQEPQETAPQTGALTPEEERSAVTQEQQPGQAQPGPEQQAAAPAGEEPATGQQQPAGQEQPAMAQQPAGQPGEEAAQQPAAPGQKDEFLGQSPKFEGAPETITLQAKNGNVTLTHKEHAGMMECKTCHGDGTPGKIPDFAKDKAHQLCQGCHKEKGAGPTKCPECHKK